MLFKQIALIILFATVVLASITTYSDFTSEPKTDDYYDDSTTTAFPDDYTDDDNSTTVSPDDYSDDDNRTTPLSDDAKHLTENPENCHIKPCTENAVCQTNGICICNESYVKFPSDASLNFHCITQELYKKQGRKFENEKTGNASDWDAILYIILGAIVICAAFALVCSTMIFTHRGRLDVKGNNDLYH